MFYIGIHDDLELHLLTEAHVPALHRLIEANRAELRIWMPWVDGTRTLEDTRRFVRFGLRQHARGSGMNAGIWFQGQLAGVISYNYIDYGKQQTEIGYWLGAAYQGYGLMTAACRAMTTHAFSRLSLQRVEIHCAAHNLKGRAIPERLGYELEGVAHQLDWNSEHYIETVVYGMTAAHWQEMQTDERENRRRGQL